MGMPVVTVASGGLPVVDVTATTGRGTPVSEATNLRGTAVTKVTSGGMAVAYETLGGGTIYAAFDPATISNVTLSGGNLVATSAGGTTDHGAHVAAVSGKTTGKYYFEVTVTTYVGGVDTGIGIGTSSSTYAGMGANATVGDEVYTSLGSIYANGTNFPGGLGGGVFVNGDVLCLAVDLDNRKIWFRRNSGVWNNSGTNNPATNTGGITIPAGAMVPFTTFNASGNVHTANFGATAFSGAVPSGFTSGWLV